MRTITKVAACSALLMSAGLVSSEEMPTSWMLLIRSDNGAAFAPATYETMEECGMVATKINDHTTYGTDCLPARYSNKQVRDFVAEQNARNREAKEKADLAAKLRPQLEAERQEILSDRIKRNTLRYMDRLKEIESLIGPPSN